MASHHVVNNRWREKVETIDPSAIRFTIVESCNHVASCNGCIFIDQPSDVCCRANKISLAAGIPDCDDPLPSGRSGVYAIDKSDPRQIQMELGK